MPFYERGDVRIYYEEAGSGFPLFLIPGGGLNSTISYFSGNAPFNAIEEFKDEYRCITADLRNANGGQSSGPLEIDRPWDAYADDQLGLMDHLSIYPWKEPRDLIPQAVRQVRDFLRAHTPVTAAG